MILDRWAEAQNERLPAIVADLIQAGIDILVTAAPPATMAAKEASNTVPIVMVGVSDPVALGIVASLAQPGYRVLVYVVRSCWKAIATVERGAPDGFAHRVAGKSLRCRRIASAA